MVCRCLVFLSRAILQAKIGHKKRERTTRPITIMLMAIIIIKNFMIFNLEQSWVQARSNYGKGVILCAKDFFDCICIFSL